MGAHDPRGVRWLHLAAVLLQPVGCIAVPWLLALWVASRFTVHPYALWAVGAAGLVVACSRLDTYLKDRSRRRCVQRVNDPVLGILRLNEDGMWRTKVDTGAGRVEFTIDGDLEPSGESVAHARQIVESFAAFQERVAAFLAEHAGAYEAFADEVRSLKVETVHLSDTPDRGMIFFVSPDVGRLWRCDYRDGEPTSLGYDS